MFFVPCKITILWIMDVVLQGLQKEVLIFVRLFSKPLQFVTAFCIFAAKTKKSDMSTENHNESLEDFVFIDGAKLSRNKETLISYEGNNKHYEIPEGIKVIGEKAFAGNSQLQSIIIPESVEIIKSEAFELCKTLKHVSFKGTSIEIGEYCFFHCEALYDITLPAITKIVGICAFCNTAIENITIPETVGKIERLFISCEALKRVVFKGTTIEIGDACFLGCKSLYDIVLPEHAKTIGESAFEDCESLNQIYIPGTVKSISANAFSRCKRLKDVVLSEGVKQIDYWAFNNCDNLEEIRLPYSMENVEEGAFSHLKRCFYSNPKTVFKENAFEWCGNDFRLFLPKHADYDNAVKSMPKGIIGRNTDPEKGPINYDHLYYNMVPYMADVPIDILLKGPISLSTWRSLDYYDKKGGVYTNGMQSFLCLDKNYFRYENKEQKQYKVLDGTKYICDYAFHLNNNSLLGREYVSNYCPFVTIELPTSVIAIGDFSFSGCSHLTKITLPPKLTYIGKNPFVGMGNLFTIESMSPSFVVDSDCLIAKETGTLIHCFRHIKQDSEETDTFTVPSCVTIIGDYSFADRDVLLSTGTTYVRRVIIPKTVTHIGKGAFEKNGFLKEVVIEGENVTIDEDAFRWCSSLKRISLPKNLKVLSNNLFEYCKSLTEIFFPDSVTEIGDSVFNGCTSLLSITLPSKIRKIGVNPFADSGVEQIINHSACFEMENGILYSKDKCEIISCISKFKRIEIPTIVKEIKENAFNNCEQLEEIIIPSSIEAIGCGAFSSCKALKNVFIEEGGISIIKSSTFSGCSSLQEFRIPDGVTEIEDNAFTGCCSLKTLYSPSSIKHVSYYAFDRNPCPVQTTWLPWSVEKNELPGKKKTMTLEESGLWMDDFGVVYSKDKKMVIKATKPLDKYSVLEGTTTIKQRAFSFNYLQRSLKEINLPNSIERIEQGAFAYCDFSNIALPESLKYIGQSIFIDCRNLKQISIPAQVSVMEGNPFLGKNYEVINNSWYFTLQNEILYSSDHSTIVSCLNKKSIKLIINEASSIGPYSFALCKAKEIVIEPPVQVIEERAFNHTCVERVILPDSLIEIKPYAFEMCLNLHEITIPSSTRFIGDCAFCGCLRRVTINSRDIKIGRDAFHSEYLTKIVVPLGCLDYFRNILPDYTNIISEQ